MNIIDQIVMGAISIVLGLAAFTFVGFLAYRILAHAIGVAL